MGSSSLGHAKLLKQDFVKKRRRGGYCTNWPFYIRTPLHSFPATTNNNNNNNKSSKQTTAACCQMGLNLHLPCHSTGAPHHSSPYPHSPLCCPSYHKSLLCFNLPSLHTKQRTKRRSRQELSIFKNLNCHQAFKKQLGVFLKKKRKLKHTECLVFILNCDITQAH